MCPRSKGYAQSTHSDEPNGAACLGSHGVHVVAESPLKVPGSHARHALFSGWLACLPAVHCVHCACPGVATQPPSHGVHCAASASAYFPASHFSHLPWSSSGADPASHGAQLPERLPAAAT